MKSEVKIGIFSVAMLLIGWGVIRYLQGSGIFERTNRYYAVYEQVGGLQTAAYVMINGVTVGSVMEVSLNEDPTKGVEVEFTVDKRYKIPVDSKARIFSDGIMGGKAVEIVYGSSNQYVEAGGEIAPAMATDLMDMASTELDFLKRKIEEVVGGLTKTLDGVNTLLAQNTDNLTSIVANVDGVTGSVNSMLTKEKEHLEIALSSLSRFSKSLGDNAEQIDTIIDNMSRFSSQLADSRLVAEVEGVVTQLNTVLASVNDKSGSVGKMLGDAELYDNLASASNNLSTLLEDLKENPHRYINISVFGANPTKKAEKAKAKAEKRAIKRADEIAEREAEVKLKSLNEAEKKAKKK